MAEEPRWDSRQSPWQPRWATGSRVSDTSRNTLTGATGAVTAVACVHLGGRAVAVTGGVDGTVRVCDLVTHTSIGEPLMGHADPVTAVACTQMNGCPIAVTGDVEGTVRVWDLTSGIAIDLLTGHTGSVTAVACTQLDGRPSALTSGRDHTVRIWDLRTRLCTGRIDLPSEAEAVTGTAAGDILAAFGWDIVLLERSAERLT